MAEAKAIKTPAKKTTTPRKTAAKKPAASATTAQEPAAEAKSRFNAALEEAKAGAAALRSEAGSRRDDLVGEAKVYGTKAKESAMGFATQGKTAASDAISSLGKVVSDTAVKIDERFGEQYGDYARKASRSLAETSASLEAKSVEEKTKKDRNFQQNLESRTSLLPS